MQKGFSIIVTLFFIWLALEAFAQTIPEGTPVQSERKPTIAITTFENLSAYPENAWVAMSFSEALATKLNNLYERFRVVERLRIYAVIREQGFDPERISSLETRKQQNVGSLMGADYLVFGSVSLQGSADDMKTPLMANIRTVDVQTGGIKEAHGIQGKMEQLFELETQLTYNFLKQMGIEPTPEESERLNFKETLSIIANKYYSLGQKAFYDGDYETAKGLYDKAIETASGVYYQLAELGLIKSLEHQKEIGDESEKSQVIAEAQRRREDSRRKRAEANERLYAEAQYSMIAEEYESALESFQQYLDLTKPWQLVKWKTKVDGKIGEMMPEEKIVFMVDYAGKLTALTKEDGELKWSFEPPEKREKIWKIDLKNITFPIGRYVFRQDGNILWALDEETGKELWKFEAPLEEDILLNTFFEIRNGLVYFGPQNGLFYALACDTGQLKWQFDRIPGLRGIDPRLMFLFNIPLKFQTELNSGNFPNSLRQLFMDHGHQIGQDATVSIEPKDDNWLVTEISEERQSRYVIINRKKEDKLGVYIEQTIPMFKTIHGTNKDYIEFCLINPFISYNTVYVCKYDNPSFTLTALNAKTGVIRWRSEVPVSPSLYLQESLIVASGTIYMITLSGVLALSEKTGELKWHSDLKWYSGILKGSTLLISETGIIYICNSYGLAALSTETGKIRWEKNFGDLTYMKGDITVNRHIPLEGIKKKGTIFMEPIPGIHMVNEVMLYRLNDSYTKGNDSFSHTTHEKPDKLYAISAETGESLWEFGVEGEIDIPIVKDKLVFLCTEKGFYAIEIDTGKVRWRIAGLSITARTSLRDLLGPSYPWYIAQKSNIYFISPKGFYVIAMETGKIEWESTGLGSIENYAITEDGMVYINSSNMEGQNIIYALN